jgi:hypothetical protein
MRAMLRRFFVLFATLGAAACREAPAEVSAAECPVFLADGILPSSPEEAAARKEKGTSFSNRDVRARYVCWVGRIGALNEQWKAEGLAVAERAKRAYEARHMARVTARAMMTSADEVRLLQERDRAKYGNPDGPTFDWLVEKAKKKGLAGDQVFEDIIASAQKTDEATNKAFGL